MKAVIFFALFVAVAFGFTCSILTCVDNGQTCGATVNGQGGFISQQSCNAGSGCEHTSTTLNYTGTCKSFPGNNADCLSVGSATLCAPGYTCSGSKCTKATGTFQNTILPGVSCSSDEVCLADDGGATTSACPTSGVCPFVADQGTCSLSSTGYYCNVEKSYCAPASGSTTGTCTPRVADGADCSVTDGGSCSAYSLCAPTATSAPAGKCVVPYSVAVGSPCNGAGMCVLGSYCPAPTTVGTFTVCTAAPTTVHGACTSTLADCVTDGSQLCSCNSAFGSGASVCLSLVPSTGAQAAVNNFRTCNKNNHCANYGTCLNEFCAKEKCELGKVLVPDLFDANANCGLTCTGAGSTVVVSYFVLATLAAFVMF